MVAIINKSGTNGSDLPDPCVLIVVKGPTDRARILIALGEPVIGVHTGVDV